MDPVRFVCEDCDADVFLFCADKAPDPPVCSVCQFIREIPDALDREHLRRALELGPTERHPQVRIRRSGRHPPEADRR